MITYYQFVWEDDKYVTPLKTIGTSIEVKSEEKGVLISLGSMSDYGRLSMIRVIRKSSQSTNDVVSVDVPLINCRMLYDNGVSLNGFNWEKVASVAAATMGGTNPEKITYMGEECIVQ